MDLETRLKEKVREEFQDCDNGFHNFQHTGDFVEAAKKICDREDVADKDRENVILAGWLHDIGAVENYEGHVDRGAKKAGKILEELGLEEERIEKIQKLIGATYPQKEPQNLLEEIMQDSDAAFLARDDYFEKLEGMWREFAEQGIFDGDLEDFFRDSISYIDIEYHTDAARKLFDEERKENLRKLREKVS
jgi:HD superfamily phosphodiesterase